jgi:GH43 family beta-xylosidase
MIRRQIIWLCLTSLSVSGFAQASFTNPLLPSGADPWAFYKDGFYYYTNTLGNRIDIWKTDDLANLKSAKRKTIWTPPAKTLYSKNIWAPEIHFINNKWYVYFAADDGRNENHRLYVLENDAEDPFAGEWELKGKIADPSDKWAIDGSAFSYRGKLYFVWSGWQGDRNGRQDIYIAEMANPWTLKGKRVMLSQPTYPWERHGSLDDSDNPQVYVNEGPQFIERNGQAYIIFSASGCWTDYYALGMLRASSSNLLDSTSWTKTPAPVFQQSPANDVWAPGHNSFFKSPDGKEDWILYHANDDPGQGCGRDRSPRAQPFTWTLDGIPVFGEPVRVGVPILAPSK